MITRIGGDLTCYKTARVSNQSCYKTGQEAQSALYRYLTSDEASNKADQHANDKGESTINGDSKSKCILYFLQLCCVVCMIGRCVCKCYCNTLRDAQHTRDNSRDQCVLVT